MKPYQVKDSDLNDEQRHHLHGRLFPRLAELTRVAGERLAARRAESSAFNVLQDGTSRL